MEFTRKELLMLQIILMRFQNILVKTYEYIEANNSAQAAEKDECPERATLDKTSSMTAYLINKTSELLLKD